jgi:hypothetical protein
LNAIGNTSNVARVIGMKADATGRITVTVKANPSSTTFGSISLLDLSARLATSPITEDYPTLSYTSYGATPNPAAAPNPANPHGLRAYVYEYVDGFSNKVGLGELLRRAGFHVEPLPLDRPPYDPNSLPATDVDLIAFGSFASESAEYRAYMNTYGSMLDDYIDRAGFLVQFAQADQTELNPPYLPDTQDATRSDTDFEEAFILAPNHPILANVPKNASGRIQYRLWDSASGYDKNTLWETFQQFFGFEVLLSGDTRARNPGLMEGAYGQGRFMLTAMAVDKILDPNSGAEVASTTLKPFNAVFFKNLYTIPSSSAICRRQR